MRFGIEKRDGPLEEGVLRLPSRRKRRLKWAGTVVCILTFLVSWAWGFTPDAWHPHPAYFGVRWGFRVWAEVVAVYVTTIVPPSGTALADYPVDVVALNKNSLRAPLYLTPLYGQEHSNDVGLLPRLAHEGHRRLDGSHFLQTKVYIPLVLIPVPILLLGVPATALLWYLDRRRPGFCDECGYNLTGNVSGRCPECGTVHGELHTPAADRAAAARE